MTWLLPTPADIAARMAGDIEQALETSERRVDARSPGTVLSVLTRAQALSLYELWLQQRWLAEELMPDTAAEWLDRHADVWGVPRLPATAAIGVVVFTGAAGTIIPAATELRAPGGALYATDAAVTLAGDGTAATGVTAAAAGAAGNLAMGVQLALVSPVAGLSPQRGAVGADGLAGGAEAEADEALRARLLARIRVRPHGGAAFDYEAWARAVSPEVAHVAVYGGWIGHGSVGVVVGMHGPREPSGPELDRIEAAIEAARPVTAHVVVLGATLLPVHVTIALDPDTVPVRAAVQAALEAFFARDARIGAKLPLSRLSEAISSAAGEYSHALIAPTADILPDRTELPELGSVSFT